MKEVNHACPGVPILLVGLKSDTRENRIVGEGRVRQPLHFVTSREGHASAQEIGVTRYVECSALTGRGIDGVFEAATRVSLVASERLEGDSCCIVL